MKVIALKKWGFSAFMFLLLTGFGISSVYAQDGWEDSGSSWEDSGDSWADDTTDFGGENYDDPYGGYGDTKKEEEPEIIRKPYVRFVPPYDSTHELVTYDGVVQVMETFDGKEYEVETDTILFRANQWLEEEFGKKKLKEFITTNGVNTNASELEYKIILNGTFPCMVKPNEATEYQNGEIKFTMELRIREGRYRYKITNLVHIAPVRANEKEGIATYFEYLMKTDNDVRSGDVILISADTKINAMLASLEKKCKTGPILEDDEW